MAKKSLFSIILLYGMFIGFLVLYWAVYIFLPEVHGSYFRGEDRLVEWLTFVFFLAASVLSFLTLVYRNTMTKLAILYFVIMGVFLFVCAGEEISWGQRIFGFKTPENIAIINEQKELNLHNLNMKNIHPQGIFSFIMSLYGIILPIVFSRQLINKTSPIRRYISPLVLVPCFLFPVILGFSKSLIVQYSTKNIPRYGDLTNELREMYWGLSVFLASITLYINNRRIIHQHLTYRSE